MFLCISLGASAAVKCKAVTQKGTQYTRANIDGNCKQYYDKLHLADGEERCHASTMTGLSMFTRSCERWFMYPAL